MAKLYRYPEGGAFYDAFGGKIGEIEEVWAGDSFNRDATICAYDVATNTMSDAVVTAKGLARANTGNLYCSSNIKDADVTIDRCDSLSMELKKIQAQINDFKQNFVPKKDAHSLRSALKTLQYKREVE